MYNLKKGKSNYKGGINTLPEHEERLPQQTPQAPRANPLDIAQKRLAYGEITLREYQKIARALVSF